MQNTIDFSGIWIPNITPFAKDNVYKIDYKKLAKLYDYLIEEQKADGIVPFGTTGEYSTLSYAEEKEGLTFTLEHIRGRVPVMAATGTNDTRTTITMTQDAELLGADAAMLVVPYYNRPSQEGLFSHFSTVAQNTSLPIFIYNIPSRTGVNLMPKTVFKLIQKHSNIYGIKDVSCDSEQTKQLINYKKEINHPFYVFSGEDCKNYYNFEIGGDGAISASANIFGTEMQNMWQAYKNGEKEKGISINQNLQKIFQLLFQEPNPAPIKACFDLMNLDFGGNLRLPLLKATDSLRSELKTELEKLNKL